MPQETFLPFQKLVPKANVPQLKYPILTGGPGFPCGPTGPGRPLLPLFRRRPRVKSFLLERKRQ